MLFGRIGSDEVEEGIDMKLRKEIEEAINRNSAENGSGTPDFILAEFLTDSLAAFDKATKERERWYGYRPCGFPPSTPEAGTQPQAPNDEAMRRAKDPC